MEVILWLALPSAATGLVLWLLCIKEPGRAVLGPVRVLAGRVWGSYHRFLGGKQLQPGERELYRARLQGVSVYAVDHETRVEQRPICIVTNRRLMARDTKHTGIEILLADVGSVRPCRDHDSRTGFSYWVAIDRARGAAHDVQGDICLHCESQQQSQELTRQIQSAAAQVEVCTPN